ncbi:MAG: phage holin family protein [Solirubrobacterales bacterium]|nr:phage holin family protein [Solirubrobacterales bacterium]
MPAENGTPEKLVGAVSEVSDRITTLVREEIELAKAEVTRKAISLGKGAVAVLAGAMFGVYAVLFLLMTIAWALDSALIEGAGDIWEGFAIVTGGLAVLTALAFIFAQRLFKRGAPPTPTMAIEEAKQIRETVATKSGIEG